MDGAPSISRGGVGWGGVGVGVVGWGGVAVVSEVAAAKTKRTKNLHFVLCGT
jgi:hypothetical protein